MSTLRMAWRNLIRNRRRTGITVLAVIMSTAILVVSLALTDGMLAQVERNVTRLQVGDAQVHAEGYRKERSIYLALSNPEALMAAAEKVGAKSTPRSFGFGLLSHKNKSAGVVFTGVDPAREAQTFELASSLAEGQWLAPKENKKVQKEDEDAPPSEVIIGRRLARSLKAEIGAQLVAVVQAADGSTGAELLTVRGILRPVSEEIDRGGVFMSTADFDELFVAGGRVHELAIALNGAKMKDLRAAMAPQLKGAQLQTWQELMPPVAELLGMLDASIAIYATIFFLSASLGVLNTMLMATYDRVREFGVIKALGGTAGRIILDVATEGLLLGLVATAIGLLLGAAASLYFQTVGIDLSGLGQESISMNGIAWDAVMYARLTVGQLLISAGSMIAACVIASIYPAIKASRLSPVDAMTHR